LVSLDDFCSPVLEQ
jgi:hypothetical protein